MKSLAEIEENENNSVAPFAGAWIEIMGTMPGMSPRQVAPFAGAWIEIAKQDTRGR